MPLEDLPDCAMFMLPGSRRTGEQGNAGEVGVQGAHQRQLAGGALVSRNK